MNNINFLGFGLMAGSLAKCIKKNNPGAVLKATASPKTVSRANAAGLIENEVPLPLEEMADCDLLVLSAPVGVNVKYLWELAPFIKGDTIITDVGSVKGDIHRAANELLLNDRFVGGHPMAGSEKTGFEAGSAELIENCRYVLTTWYGKETESYKRLRAFLEGFCKNILFMDCYEHDFTVAAISHLPHIAASTLAKTAVDNDMGYNRLLASSGFRDSTRVAAGDPDMWEQICIHNSRNITKMLRAFSKELNEIADLVEGRDGAGINRFFSEAKKDKESFP